MDGPNNLNIKIFDNIDETGEIDFLDLFHHAAENKDLAKAMNGRKGAGVMAEFFSSGIALKISKKYEPEFKKGPDQKMLRFLSNALAAAITSLLISWIEDEMSLSQEKMAAVCRQLVASAF